MDCVPKHIRSRIMAAVPQANTRPEMRVRQVAHCLGFRFRLHRRDLPGSPDIVFPRRKAVVFVHGCFWHHHGCSRSTVPSSNRAFWNKKFLENQRRDARVRRRLRQTGWRVLVVWECQTRDPARVASKLCTFLSADPPITTPVH